MGIVHSEMLPPEFQRTGGTLQGFQIWVNLPRNAKMSAPRYQEIPSANIPTVESNSMRARVIAGSAQGRTGAIETRSPVLFVHYTLGPGSTLTEQVSARANLLAYVIQGEGRFHSESPVVREGQMALFAPGGETIVVTNEGNRPPDFLLLGGEPLNEPIARYGPFVMNTREELVEAYQDFRSGKMGQIASAVR